jgi:hypothetical protein
LGPEVVQPWNGYDDREDQPQQSRAMSDPELFVYLYIARFFAVLADRCIRTGCCS